MLDQRFRIGNGSRYLRFDFFQRDVLVGLQHQQAPDEVLEFAHVVRPRIIAQPVLRSDAEAAETQALGVDQLVHVIIEELRHVFRILAKRRHAQRQHPEVRNQVTAQPARVHRLVVIRPHGRHDPCVERHRVGTALARETAILQHAEEYPLPRRAEVRQLVDEQRALARLLEHAHVHLPVLFAAEQALLDVVVDERSRRDVDKRSVGTPAQRVQVASERAATGAGLTADQDSSVVPRVLLDLVTQRLHQRTAADGGQQGLQGTARRGGLPARGIQRAFDRPQEFSERQRLLDEIVCA